jgi:hypothetical protein
MPAINRRPSGVNASDETMLPPDIEIRLSGRPLWASQKRIVKE